MYRLIPALFLFVVLASCGGRQSFLSLSTATSGASIAVVSLSVNDFGGSLQGWNQTRTSDLMTWQAADMVRIVEQYFSNYWQVIPAETFVGRDDYLELAGPPRDVAVPHFEGGYMPLFGYDRSDLIRARLLPEKAQALTHLLGVDFVAVVYAEWGVVTGSFVPTSKALSKNVLSIFDADGREVFHGRADARGDRTLGAFGMVVVDENSIEQWVMGFERGIDALVSR